MQNITLQFPIMYQHNIEELKLDKLAVGDWIDLPIYKIFVDGQPVDKVAYSKGATVHVSYGFACKIPDGYEMIIAPRSSTFQKYGLLLTNSIGVVDNSYCGPNDIVQNKFFATRDGVLSAGLKIAQFRLLPNQPKLEFVETGADGLGNNRGGFGSTGN